MFVTRSFLCGLIGSRLFFLQHLAESSDFYVDFAHVIDDRLADFLQSPAAVECLERGGYALLFLPLLLVAVVRCRTSMECEVFSLHCRFCFADWVSSCVVYCECLSLQQAP